MRRYIVLLGLTVLLAGSGFTLLPHNHGVACAHDSMLNCVPEVSSGDRVDKGDSGRTQMERNDARPDARPSGVRVLGHADPGGGFNADVVAHRNHAYLGSWGTFGDPEWCPSQGVRVFDLTDPRDPTMVATFADAASEPDVTGTWTEKVIVRRVNTASFRGDMAVVSFQNCVDGEDIFRGFGVYDVTDPSSPERLSLVRTDSRAGGSHELALDVRGGSAYVYTAVILSELTTSDDGTTPGEPDFQIWDVGAPTNPTKVGEWGAWAELGIEPVAEDDEGAFRVNFVHSVIADGKGRAYVSYWDLGTVILDVTDPTGPTFVGRTGFDREEEGNAHSAAVSRNGRLLVETNEDFWPFEDGGFEEAWGYTHFYDIRDPGNPVELATFELPTTRLLPPGIGDFTAHDPKIRGNDLYLSYYAEGVVVLDIGNPAQPRQKAQFVPTPAADPRGLFFPGEEFPFVWGVWVEPRYVLASDINSGLWVFQLR